MSISTADWFVHHERLSPKLRYLTVVMLEAQSASKSWSPSSELPRRLSHMFVIGTLFLVIFVAMCTKASLICSLVRFISRMVKTCKFAVF